MARCEWSGRDRVIWRVRSVTWRSEPRTGSFAQLLSFSLLPCAALAVPLPDRQTHLVGHFLWQPLLLILLICYLWVQTRSCEGNQRQKMKRVCVLSNDWRVFLIVPLWFPSFFFFPFSLEILFEALSWWGFLFVCFVFSMLEMSTPVKLRQYFF